MWDLSEGCKTQKNVFNDNDKNVITYGSNSCIGIFL